MLYKSNNEIYLLANNKYYKVEVEKDNLIPSKKAKYEIENKFEITYKDAMDFLNKDNKNNRGKIQDRIE